MFDEKEKKRERTFSNSSSSTQLYNSVLYSKKCCVCVCTFRSIDMSLNAYSRPLNSFTGSRDIMHKIHKRFNSEKCIYSRFCVFQSVEGIIIISEFTRNIEICRQGNPHSFKGQFNWLSNVWLCFFQYFLYFSNIELHSFGSQIDDNRTDTPNHKCDWYPFAIKIIIPPAQMPVILIRISIHWKCRLHYMEERNLDSNLIDK